jgi:hypothetical protein
MTAQVSDTFILKGEAYSLIGVSGTGLVVPEKYGMKAEMIHTACYRGFYATYEITEETLYLREYTLNEKNRNYLPIEGVLPKRGSDGPTYSGLNVLTPYTGKLRLAKDFIEELYIHMGYQKPSAYKTVLDLTLKNGRVVEIKDRSEEMEKHRGAFKKRYESSGINERIDDAFSLDMDLE